MAFSRAGMLAVALVACGSSMAEAHFPWLATDDEGRALLFFSENPIERDYRLPDSILEAKVQACTGDKAPTEVKLATVEADDYVGRRTEAPAEQGAALEAAVQYGIYHGMLLDYYVKGLTNVDAARWRDSAKSKTLKLNATPQLTTAGVELAVMWEGKPLVDATVTMVDSEGESSEAKTDKAGVARFDGPREGLVGFLVNRMDAKAAGKVDGEEYSSAGQYATVTILYEKSAKASPAKSAASTVAEQPAATADALPSLPEAVASFGGAVCDGWLYVYSGHIGTEHDHSKDNLSGHFRRMKIDGGSQWEELPMQTPLQGLPLVAHGGKLYRVGGLSARNAADEEADLHSVAEFACFDPATKTWTELASLPEARSSHDAAVIGDVLYVVGGWTLAGEGHGEWLPTAWSFDLKEPNGQWQAVASPTFKRRALAVAAWNGKLVAVGGMDDNDKVSVRGDVLDLSGSEWTQLPALPGGKLRGFGVSAWTLGDDLFVSGAEGVVYRLSPGGDAWESVGKLATGRFFHRLLPGGASSLLAVAGASFSDGHLASIETFAPQADN